MARAYAGILGAIALTMVVLRGVLAGELITSVVMQGLFFQAVFSAIGLAIGWSTDLVLRQSLEFRFRQEVEQYNARQTASTESRQIPS